MRVLHATCSLFFRISIHQFASLIRNLSFRLKRWFRKTEPRIATTRIKFAKAIYQKHYTGTRLIMYFHRSKIVTPWSWSMKWRNTSTKTCRSIFKTIDRSASEPNPREENFHFHPSSTRPQPFFILSSLPAPLHTWVEGKNLHTHSIQVVSFVWSSNNNSSWHSSQWSKFLSTYEISLTFTMITIT